MNFIWDPQSKSHSSVSFVFFIFHWKIAVAYAPGAGFARSASLKAPIRNAIMRSTASKNASRISDSSFSSFPESVHSDSVEESSVIVLSSEREESMLTTLVFCLKKIINEQN